MLASHDAGKARLCGFQHPELQRRARGVQQVLGVLYRGGTATVVPQRARRAPHRLRPEGRRECSVESHAAAFWITKSFLDGAKGACCGRAAAGTAVDREMEGSKCHHNSMGG